MLIIEDLVCGYPESGFLLKEISFGVKAGQLVGIIGPNGSGKSTLLKAISKVLKPQQGRIWCDGQDIARLSYRALAQKMAVVSQWAETSGAGFTVKDFVLLGRIPYRHRFCLMETRQDLQIANRVMMAADVGDLAARDISQLSGGERQRAIIARSLCQEPELLLLDEPTTHLDIGHQVETLNLVRKLNQDGLTVVIVLHDLNLASLYCDQLILLVDGGIHAAGPPEEILKQVVIEEVYRTPVVIAKNPVNGKPLVCLISGG